MISALKDNVRDLPGGSLRASEGDILLRGLGTASDIESIERIALRSNPMGGQLLMKEVARVERRLEETWTIGRFNGKCSVNLTITKTAEASTIEVSKRVRNLAQELRKVSPPSIQIGLFSDLSV